jgi:hypothetical protein
MTTRIIMIGFMKGLRKGEIEEVCEFIERRFKACRKGSMVERKTTVIGWLRRKR